MMSKVQTNAMWQLDLHLNPILSINELPQIIREQIIELLKEQMIQAWQQKKAGEEDHE
jgi:hypothetical protein